jgi:hypothetical protein
MLPSSARYKFAGSLGYLWLLIPTSLTALFHVKLIPLVRRGFDSLLEGATLPHATDLALAAGPLLFTLPIIVIFVAVASTRIHTLQHPIVLGLFGSGLATFFLFYALCLILPFGTVEYHLGDAQPREGVGIAEPLKRR